LTLVAHPDDMASTFHRAVSHGDIAAIRELMDENVVQRSLDGNLVSGEAVIDALQALVNARAQLKGKHRFSAISGDVALIVADFELALDGPAGDRTHMEGTVTNVLRRHSDGGWRFAVLNPRGVD